MRPNYAYLFVGYVEHQIREQYTGFISQLHKKYIADIVGAASCKREELESFIDFVSNFHPAFQSTSSITEIKLPSLDINLRISDDRIQPSVFYKGTDTHNYLHFSSAFHPDHCKCAIPYSQFLRLGRLCSDDDDFHVSSWKMITFFSQRGYPISLLENDLRRIATIRCPDALRPSQKNNTTDDRAPLVLTYHPFNTQIKRCLPRNFRILSTDQQTQKIFPHPLFVAYKRDISLRNMLVHSADNSSIGQSGSRGCEPPRCHNCRYISPHTSLNAPFIFGTCSPANPRMLCIAYFAAVVHFFTLERQDEASEVALMNT